MSQSLVRASSVMALGTIASRVTGVLRDITAAAALGFYLVADAFSLGNTLPTIIYILVVGGALNAVFVPQLVRRMKDDPDGGRAYADRLVTLVGLILLVLSLTAVVAAPLIVDLYTPADYPAAEYELAVAFARLCLPQIFFYGLYTMLSQVLNSRGKFGAPMFAPIANNVVAIATFLLFIAVAGTSAAADGALSSREATILGVGTTLGVVMQSLILIPVLRRSGHVWRPRFDWRDAGMGRAGILAFWTIALVLVNQATAVVVTRLATQANIDAAAAGVTAAGLTTYQKAHLVFMLPHSVITVSVVTAMLPALSRVAHSGDFTRMGRELGSTMRFVSALIVPIASVLMVTGAGLAVLLFGYGAAVPGEAAIMGQIVSVFMFSLLPFTLFYVLLRGFYALEDTRTPFFITLVFSVVWLALAVPLFGIVGSGGPQVASLAFTYGLSYWIGLIIAWIVLARRIGSLDSRRTVWAVARMLVAGGLAVGAMVATRAVLVGSLGAFAGQDKVSVLLSLVVLGLVGGCAYLVAAWAMRIREISEALTVVRRKVLTR